MKAYLTFILFFFILALQSLAQKPREIQVDNEPVNWQDTATIIVLIVIPIVALIFYVIWRNRLRRKREDN